MLSLIHCFVGEKLVDQVRKIDFELFGGSSFSICHYFAFHSWPRKKVIEYILFLFLRLEKLGGLEWTKVVQKHQGWRLITCIWLHAGIIHLLVNMLCLVFIGIRLEQQFGFGMLLFHAI